MKFLDSGYQEFCFFFIDQLSIVSFFYFMYFDLVLIFFVFLVYVWKKILKFECKKIYVCSNNYFVIGIQGFVILVGDVIFKVLCWFIN